MNASLIQMYPMNWVLLKYTSICRLISLQGKKIKQNQYLRSGKYPVVDQGLDLIGGFYNDDSRIVSSEPPFIVFGDHTKIIKYIDFRFIPGADGIKVLKAFEFFAPKLLYYFLHCIKLPDRGYARHYQYLEKSQIPLPPLPEQHRIVAKIEELFSEIDKGVEALKAARSQCAVYRQSVLKHAFEGKLTEAWRKKNGHDVENRDNETVGNDSVGNGHARSLRNMLPEGWDSVSIDQFLVNNKKGMATGPFGTALKKSEHQTSGVPVLGIENIGEGIFQMPNKIFVSISKAKELKAFTVIENDIIISRSGTVGEICAVPAKMENSLISTNIIRVRLNCNVILPKYFVYMFQGGDVRKQVFDLCKGSSRAFLNQTILKTLSFPYCPLPEQSAIVSEIESRLSVCDKLEATIEQSLAQAESLRQSILKKAFEGKLVPQDPEDEPAGKLLERIRSECVTDHRSGRACPATTKMQKPGSGCRGRACPSPTKMEKPESGRRGKACLAPTKPTGE
jgi:type I restriction enzyme S subunit